MPSSYLPGRTRKKATTSKSRERLRRKYRPKCVNILFVGEAAPASGRFFYQADSGLYRAIRDTFVAALSLPRAADAEFLDSFRALGCYLVDLCGTPVDRMEPHLRRSTCQGGEALLVRRLRELRPKIVITVVQSIGRNVRRAEKSARWSGLHVELPYPGRWHRFRLVFRRKLIAVLRSAL